MTAGELCIRETAIIEAHQTALEAAKVMLDFNVGSLVVVEREAAGNKPVGIVTDRDLALKVVAGDALAEAIPVSAIMSEKLLTATEIEKIYDLLPRMQFRGVRRVPVIDEQGYLSGILTADDILEFQLLELSGIMNIIKKERPRF